VHLKENTGRATAGESHFYLGFLTNSLKRGKDFILFEGKKPVKFVKNLTFDFEYKQQQREYFPNKS
jgi:hypothetical protein